MNGRRAKSLRIIAKIIGDGEPDTLYAGVEINKPYFITNPATLKKEVKMMPFVQSKLMDGCIRKRYKELKRLHKQ